MTPVPVLSSPSSLRAGWGLAARPRSRGRIGPSPTLPASSFERNSVMPSPLPPLTGSAFDLPAHLAPKADPHLIARDEQQFAAISDALSTTTAELTARLDELRRTPAGAGQAGLDRDLEIHRLTQRLRALARFRLDV